MTPDELTGLYASVPDPPALRGLSDLDWSALHAHGPATDVPSLLRALASDVPDHREFACALLHETVWYQGTIFGASATVVPFLYALLEAEDVPSKDLSACLIASIVDGNGYLLTNTRTPEDVAMWEGILAKQGKTLSTELNRERAEVAAVKRAGAHRLDLLLPYLRHPAPDLRLHIAAAFGCLPERAVHWLPELEAILRDETDEYVREVLGDVVSHLA